MSIPQDVIAHKTMMIALLAVASEVADELGLKRDLSVTGMARQLEASRTSVYEQKERLSLSLATLLEVRPGRPQAQSDESREPSLEALRLECRVQRFRLEHPDAIVAHPTRSGYSPSFRRFILGELDAWQGCRATFAEASGVPLDTLSDWVRADSVGLTPTAPIKKHTEVPVDASAMAREIVEQFEKWEGSTRSFVGFAREHFGLTNSQVVKVLRICGAITTRSRRPFRYRGSTDNVSPGALLVTDGKTLDILLTESEKRLHQNWQGIVDQATGCDTAVVVSDQEDAAAVRKAFANSLEFLADVPPDGFLYDNKPCYQDAGLQADLEEAGTLPIAATPCRPENKAILEGAFSLFETRVGTIRLDDTSVRTLISSAVREVIRAYVAATNATPRPEFGGLSRQAALRLARPSADQKAADRAFIRALKERHERVSKSDWRRRVKSTSQHLLDNAFARLGIEHLDPQGSLREYLSVFEPAAIRLATTIVSARIQARELNMACAHRYFAKVVRSMQESIDLNRQSMELLELCRLEAQDWVSQECADHEALKSRCTSKQALARALAARAAAGSLPVTCAFWTQQLMTLLGESRELIAHVRRFLIRLYEAPEENRLLLLNHLAEFETGLAMA